MNSVFVTFCNHILGPDRALNLTDMCLSKEEHTDSGLSNAASDGVRKLLVKNSLLERKLCALGAACLLKLALKGILINTDTHAGELKSDVQNRIVYDDVSVELPVIIVRGAAVVLVA
jgi:hypothetical protein